MCLQFWGSVHVMLGLSKICCIWICLTINHLTIKIWVIQWHTYILLPIFSDKPICLQVLVAFSWNVGTCRTFQRSFRGLTVCLRIPCHSCLWSKRQEHGTDERAGNAIWSGDFLAIEVGFQRGRFKLLLTHWWNGTNTFHRSSTRRRPWFTFHKRSHREKKRKTDDVYSGPNQTGGRSFSVWKYCTTVQLFQIGKHGGICCCTQAWQWTNGRCRFRDGWFPSKRRVPPNRFPNKSHA